MQFVSCVSEASDPTTARRDVCDRIEESIGRPDVAFVFTSGYTPEDLTTFCRDLHADWDDLASLGATAAGVIGETREIERTRAISVLAGRLPGVTFTPYRIPGGRLEGFDIASHVPADAVAQLVVGDPFTCDIRPLLDVANEAKSLAGVPVLGGLASGASQPGGNRLLVNGALHDQGLVGLAMHGDVVLETIVSQGCRPIGRPFVVTAGESNVVKTLAGKPALEVARGLMEKLEPDEKKLAQSGLFLGRVIDEYKSGLDRGDFLIQSVIGIDPKTGVMAVGGDVRRGTTVQFHVRDADSADEDLRALLDERTSGEAPRAALLFSCNGRGTYMWDEGNHDVRAIQSSCGPVPTGGFLCAGEIGPIGGKNFLHGFTAGIGLIRPKV